MLATQPTTIAGTIAAGVALFRGSFRPLLLIALIASLPQALVSSFLVVPGAAPGPEADPAEIEAYLQGLFRVLPPLYLAIMFNIRCMAHSQVRLARGEAVSWASAVADALRMTPALTLLMLAYVMIGSLGLIALVLPGVILLVNLCLFPYAPLLEQRSVWSGLARSQMLIWSRNWWRAAAVAISAVLAGLVLGQVIAVIASMLGLLQPNVPAGAPLPAGHFLTGWLTLAVFTPLSTALMLALCQDLLLRQGDAPSNQQPPESPPPGKLDA